MRTSLSLLCAAALALISCTDGGNDSPRPTSMEPSTGDTSAPVRVTIRGDGFLALPSSEQGGGGATVDTHQRAWLGDAELVGVTWIDVHTIEATVPAGLPIGPKRLEVENALGRRGALDGAFEVIAGRSAVLVANLAAAPATVAVGKPITVALTVRNTGGNAATGVAPLALSLTGAGASGALVTGPSPASLARLEPGGVVSFTWSVVPAAPGPLTFTTRAQGTDTLTGGDVTSLPAGASAQAEAPAQLTATVAATRATVNVGQAVTVTLTLTNGGTSTANITAISPSPSGIPGASCTQPTPAPAPIPSGSTSTFTFTCTAGSAGSLSITATATGTDALSGAPISATPAAPATVTVQTPAALAASLAIEGSPTTVLVGQVLTVALTVSDTGQAGANITAVQPTASPTGRASCGAPSPAPPQSLTPPAPRTFTWSCTVQSAGPLSLGATVTGTDANTGATVQASAPALALTVLVPASLTATVGASPGVVGVGQAVVVTFTVTNGGGSTVNLTAITPATGGTATASCTAPSPQPGALPAGQSIPFTWTCTALTTGTLTLTATATGTDTATSTTISTTPAAPAQVTVQPPAALTGALRTGQSTYDVSQQIDVSLVLTNTGGSAARVNAVTPGATGSASCTAVTQTVPQTVLANGGSATFSWTCSDAVAEPVTLSTTVVAVDAITGANVSPVVADIAVTVQTPAALTATLTPSATTVQHNFPVTLTLLLTNAGEATAHVATLAATKSGSGVTCTTPTPVPQDVPGSAGTATFSWTCTPTKAGTTVTFDATVTATDLNTGAPLTVPVPQVSVQVT